MKRIDLALTFGVPTFMQTLKAVADDMKIEKIILAVPKSIPVEVTLITAANAK